MPDSTVSRSVCPVCDFRIIIRETQPHERRLIEAKNAAGSDLGSDHCVAVWLGTKIIGWGDDYGTFHLSQSERLSEATGSDARERAMNAMMALWPNAPIELGEADAILEEIEFDQLVSERNRYRRALEDLAGDYGCTVIAPPDPSLPAGGEPCRERRPNEPETWCYACVATAALRGDS